MTKTTVGCCLVLCGLWSQAGLADAGPSGADATADRAEAPAAKYLLRYKFRPGETIRWEVEHRASVRTTVSGTTQTAETVTNSIKAWQVSKVEPDGRATFVQRVESVDMRQKLTGRQEVRYNSLADKKPPLGYEDVAKAVGVPLAVITLDAQGNVVRREEKRPKPTANPGYLTIPLPTDAVPVGHRWSLPADIQVTLKDGRVKKVKTRQQFVLSEVAEGLATIQVETHVLSPVDDPAVEAQLIQSKSNGSVRFDIESGRVVAQQSDLDERVHGFQGEASTLHYATRFTEKLLPEAPGAARRPTAAGASPAPPGESARRPRPAPQGARTKNDRR